jgi:hypothetical protein
MKSWQLIAVVGDAVQVRGERKARKTLYERKGGDRRGQKAASMQAA